NALRLEERDLRAHEPDAGTVGDAAKQDRGERVAARGVGLLRAECAGRERCHGDAQRLDGSEARHAFYLMDWVGNRKQQATNRKLQIPRCARDDALVTWRPTSSTPYLSPLSLPVYTPFVPRLHGTSTVYGFVRRHLHRRRPRRVCGRNSVRTARNVG